LWAFQLGIVPRSLAFGFMPFVPVFAVQIVLTLVVGAWGPAPPADRVREYFQLYDGIW
ncbi:MAG: hypothetical protein ACI9PP_001895, partial [Halobacteriales archaeon]